MDIGIPQRGGLSAEEYPLVSNALYKQNNKYRDELQHKDEHIGINLDYGDDMFPVITIRYTITHIENTIRSKIENHNFQDYETKTEEYEITHHGTKY